MKNETNQRIMLSWYLPDSLTSSQPWTLPCDTKLLKSEIDVFLAYGVGSDTRHLKEFSVKFVGLFIGILDSFLDA